MNHPLFIAALLAASTAAIHVFAGGSDVVVPLLASSLAEEPKRTLYAVWNMVSVALVMSAAALFAGSLFRFTHTTRLLVLFVSALWCAFGTVFLVVAALQPEGGWLFRLPQWALLMPAGLLGLWGGCRTAGLVRTAGIPAGSEIGRRLAGAQFHDCFEIGLHGEERPALALYLAGVSRTPAWVNCLVALRNTVVRPIGLRNTGHLGAVDARKPVCAYRIGDRAGIFTVLFLTHDEVILGESDRHLDVQVSFHKCHSGGEPTLSVSTVVHVKNLLGRIYMLFVAPMHKFIVAAMLLRLREPLSIRTSPGDEP